MTAAAVDPAAPWGWTPNGARRTAAPEINAFARSRAGRSIRARLSPSLAPRFAKQGRTDPAERVRHPTLNAYANERFLPVLEEIYSRLKAKADAAGLIQPAGDVESFWIPRRDWQDTLGWVWPTADPADDDRIMAEALEDAEALLEAAKDLPPISVRFSGAAVVPQSLMLMCTADSSNETLDSMAVLRKAAPRFRGGAWSLQESAVALGQQVSWNVAHFPKDTELWPVVQTFADAFPTFTGPEDDGIAELFQDIPPIQVDMAAIVEHTHGGSKILERTATPLVVPFEGSGLRGDTSRPQRSTTRSAGDGALGHAAGPSA